MRGTAYDGDKDDIYASLGLARQWGKRHFPGGERALAIDCYLPCNWKLQVREIRCLAKATAQMQHAHVQGRGNVKSGRTLTTIREVIGAIRSPGKMTVKACLAPVSYIVRLGRNL